MPTFCLRSDCLSVPGGWIQALTFPLHHLQVSRVGTGVVHCRSCSWKWRIVVIWFYIERLPERTPSAELIDCETLQNQYNSSFPAARITIHSISRKNSYTICVGFLWPNVILGSSSLHVNTPLRNVHPFICPGRLEIYLFLFLKLNSDVRVLALLTRAMDKVNSRWHSINQKPIEIDRGKVVANG